FRDDHDRKTFLHILTTSSKIYNIRVYSYVLMQNHFHLLVETPLGNLGEFMRHFNITYTGYYNRRHKRAGHLYQGRYKSILVDKEAYLSMLSRYIHLNPLRIKGMKAKTDREKIHYLRNYKWSSLPGYINKREKQGLIDYTLVLEEYGGDNDKGRTAYEKRVCADLTTKFEIQDKIIGQSILGKDEFIEWVKKRFLKRQKERREYPSLREIQSYRAEDEIINVVTNETGKDLEAIKRERGSLRQVVMDLLYRVGGLKGVEIGRIMGVDYSTVSQGRKRLREKLQKDRKLKQMVRKIESKLSQ
ncbi:MAG: transposase, partial [Thermodesulfovibrionia bacterium]|nr:transposase [Thermodesulfovibrionia bacterium]